MSKSTIARFEAKFGEYSTVAEALPKASEALVAAENEFTTSQANMVFALGLRFAKMDQQFTETENVEVHFRSLANSNADEFPTSLSLVLTTAFDLMEAVNDAKSVIRTERREARKAAREEKRAAREASEAEAEEKALSDALTGMLEVDLTDEGDEDENDLSGLTVKELRAKADEAGIEHQGLKKAELVAALSE